MSVLGQVQKSGVGLLKNLFRSRSLSLITLALLAGMVLSPLIASLGLLAVAGVASGSLGKSFMSILTKSSSSQAASPSVAKDSGKTAAAEKAAKKAAPAIPTGNALVDALITKLLACHLDVTTDWGTAKEVINELPESYDHIKNNMDDIRGFVFCNKIFINPDGVQADVPIHEYTHVWAEALRQQNDKEWKNIVELLKEETVLWEEVKAKYPHLSSDNEIADEVLATYSGRHGRDLLEMTARKGENPEQTFENVLAVLRRFWDHVAKFFKMKQGRDYDNLDDIADRVLADLLKGVNPSQYIDKNKISMSDRTPLTSLGMSDGKPLDFASVRSQLVIDGIEKVCAAKTIDDLHLYDVVYLFDTPVTVADDVSDSDVIKKGDKIVGLSLDPLRESPYDSYIIQRDGRIIDRKVDEHAAAVQSSVMDTVNDMRQRGALMPIVSHVTDMDVSGNDKTLQWPEELSFGHVWSDKFNTFVRGDSHGFTVADDQLTFSSYIEVDRCVRQGVAEQRLFDAAVHAVVERVNNSAQDASLTHEECGAVRQWLSVSREAPGHSADTLWSAVLRHPSVRGIPEEWKDDAKKELDDFVYTGQTRSHHDHGIIR